MGASRHEITTTRRAGRPAGLLATLVLCLASAPAGSEIPPGRLALLDSFADPLSAGHLGALFEVDALAAADANALALSSSPDFEDANDVVLLPDGRAAITDRDADPSGFGPDPNFGSGHGAVFVAAAADAAIRLLADGSDYPAGLPAGQPSIFVDPQGLAVAPDGSLLVADRDADPSGLGLDSSGFSGHGALFRVDAATGTVRLVSDGSLSTDGAPPNGATSWFEDPSAVAVDAAGRVFVLDGFGDPGATGGTGAVYEVEPATGTVTLRAVSPAFDFPIGLAARPDGLLALSDQLADPAGDGSRGALFVLDPDAALPAAATVSFLTDPRFRSLHRLDAAADSGLFVVDAFADPLGLGRLGAVWRVPPGGPTELASSDAAYRAVAAVAVSPPVEAAPTLLSVDPPSAGQEDLLTVTLGGTGFRDGGRLEAGDGILVSAVRVLSPEIAEADLEVDALAAPGPRTLRWLNPDWQPADLVDGFTVLDAPRPVLLSVEPGSAVQGEALTLVLSGGNFVDGAALDAGAGVAVLAVRVPSPERLEADVEVEAAAAPGPRTLTVTNPDGRDGSLAEGFVVLEPAPPELVEVRPFLLARGETVLVELLGTNFAPGMDADFGAGITAGKPDVRSSSRALSRLHVRPNAVEGTRDATVTNPDLRSGTLPAAVTVSQAPVLRVVGLRLDDSAGGDDDGALDPGETVGLDFELHGPGTVDATEVILRVGDPAPGTGLTILRPAVDFPDVPAGANVRRPAAPFPELRLDPGAACGEARELLVEIEAAGVLVERRLVRLPVGRVDSWRRKPVSDGVEAGGRRGAAVALADLDGDGVADLVVGAPGEDGGGSFDAGRVTATSGASDDPLWTLEGTESSGRLGAALAAVPDVDGDGLEDLLVGAPGEGLGAGRAWLVSGRDGSVLGRVEGGADDRLGAAVSPAGDRDFDGRPELAVGAPGASAGDGRVLVYTADLVELERLEGSGAEALGAALALVGDGDSDGRADLALGAPLAGGEAGAVLLWRGTGDSLRVDGAEAGARLGASLAAGRDLDADGAPDLLAGAPAAAGGAGLVLLLDGADGAELGRATDSIPGDELGAAVGLLPDLDGDGRAELVLGSPGALDGDGRLEVRGSAGALLFRRDGAAGGAGRLGESIASGRDAGGDAFADFLAGAPRAGTATVPLAGRAPAFKSQALCEVFEPCVDDAFESNEDFGSAPLVGDGTWALTLCRGDVDVFRIEPPAGRRAMVRILFRHADGDLDATLHDSGQVLVDASLSLDDDEELGPFGPGGSPWFVRVVGFEGARNDYELLVVDPDACTPSLEVGDLRVTKGRPGRVLLSWSPSEDPCHQSAPGEPAYAVYAAPTAAGSDDPAPFPAGTAFVEVTAGDLDGDYGNERHERMPPPGNRYYLVADIGQDGERGPVGHHGR